VTAKCQANIVAAGDQETASCYIAWHIALAVTTTVERKQGTKSNLRTCCSSVVSTDAWQVEELTPAISPAAAAAAAYQQLMNSLLAKPPVEETQSSSRELRRTHMLGFKSHMFHTSVFTVSLHSVIGWCLLEPAVSKETHTIAFGSAQVCSSRSSSWG
jgi:hypothetical protein